MQSRTIIRRNSQGSIPKSPLAPITTLRSVENFNNLGNVKHKLCEVSPQFPNTQCKQSIPTSPACHKVPEESSCSFGILYYTMQNILKKLVFTFPYERTGAHQLKQPNYAQVVSFSSSCMDRMSSNSLFLSVIVLSDERVFRVLEFCEHSEHAGLGSKSQRKVQEHESQCQKVTFWCDVDSSGVIGPHTSNI